ncbi:MAG: hypothetical protein HKN25_17505 [Pyrinomonadaceae bacterium]|nr:hypothetical protein [Pyrinomonadaceae bacterium]
MKKAFASIFLIVVLSLSVLAGDSHQPGDSYFGPSEFEQIEQPFGANPDPDPDPQPKIEETETFEHILIRFNLRLLLSMYL